MRKLALILAALTALAASPVLGQEGPKPDNDQSVKLSPVALPIIADGRLVNYVFVTVKVLLTPNADVLALREKEPYFRDALVRAAHRTPFVTKGDFNRIDEGKLKASLMREASQIAGPGAIQGIEVVSQQAQHRIASSR